jgi:hypothetical protein
LKTPEAAEKVGRIPIGPVRRIMQQWADDQGWDQDMESAKAGKGGVYTIAPMDQLAFATGIKRDTLDNYLLRSRVIYLSFDIADKIISWINVDLWRTDPELRDIYQNFDFTGLDHLHPTVEVTELDEYIALGISQRVAGQMLGMSPHRAHRLYRREAA